MLRALFPRRSQSFHYNVWGVAFVLPAAIFLLVFNILPVLYALVISFTSWTLKGDPLQSFSGLQNYSYALTQDIEFPRSLRTTIYYTLGLMPGFALSLFLAVLFNRNFIGKEIFRTIYFTPVVISWVVASMVWTLLLHPSFGLSANILGLFGQPGISFWDTPSLAVPAFIGISVWKSVGYWMVIFLAGLQGIPTEYHEAAAVDGANLWQRFWRVTFPLLRPTVLFVSVVGVINAFQVFTPVYIITRGGPAGASRVFPLLIYENAFVYMKWGYASALAMILFLILLIVTVIQLRVMPSEAA